jgi:hypothetical protein
MVGASAVDVVEVVSTRQDDPGGRRDRKQSEIQKKRALGPPVEAAVELDEAESDRKGGYIGDDENATEHVAAGVASQVGLPTGRHPPG